MKPAPFEYHAPTSVEEAVGLLSELGDDAKVLAGGQSLVPMLNLRLTRFDALVDIGRIRELQTIEPLDGGVRVGAMVVQREIERDELVGKVVPLVARATPFIGHFQIRNRGTLGGSLAHADPAAEYPAVALALDAGLETHRPSGARIVPAVEFFTGTWTTALEPDEILTGVRFPDWGPGTGVAVHEMARRHGDFAVAGAVCALQVDGDRVARAAVALLGMGSTPLRAAAAEAALVGAAVRDVDPADVGHLAVRDTEPTDDLHASAGLRRRAGAALTARAISDALEEAQHG